MPRPILAADRAVQRHRITLRVALLLLPVLVITLLVPPLWAQSSDPQTSDHITPPSPVAPSYTPPLTASLSNPPILPPPSEEALAPGLSSAIEGIDFQEDAVNNGSYHIPPDPHGAVGPNHVVSVVNTSIEWHTKAGAQQYSDALKDFFTTLLPVNDTFDPKVVYDQYAGRFVVVTLERNLLLVTSRILLAVSDDSDPNGTWYFGAINALDIIGTNSTWFDYPGFAVDEEAIYITGNMFLFSGGTSQGTRLWIVNKSPFYSGGALAANSYDPFASAGLGSYATAQPAHTFGSVPGTIGTFLVSTGWSSGAIDFVSVIRVTNPLGTPAFSNTFLSLGDVNAGGTYPDAPQPGTAALIDSGDSRTLNAVWRNNNLYSTMSVVPPSGGDAGEVTAYWVRMATDPVTAVPSLADHGSVGGDEIDAGAYTYYPSIAVNSFGSIALGFALSGPNTYGSAYYTGRISSDPAGTMQPVALMAAGVEPYNRAFGGSRNRWGDYSATVVDPADDRTFWVFNEYAAANGGLGDFGFPGETGRWATRWGSFAFTSPTPVSLSSFSAETGPEATHIRWTTASEFAVSGFTLLRSSSTNRAEAVSITAELIPAVGDGVIGGTYAWVDRAAPTDTPAYYWLEVVNLSGEAESYGPTSTSLPATSTLYQLFLPLLR